MRDRLRHGPTPRDPAAVAALPDWAPELRGDAARVAIPNDIDGLLARDPEAAHRWRFGVREALEGAFAEGWRVDGFAPADASGRAKSFLILDRAAGSAGAATA